MKGKKILAGLLTGAVAVSALAACGKKKTTKITTNTPTKVVTTEKKTEKKELREFEVIFKDYDGTELYSYKALEGSIPYYPGGTPERSDDSLATYTFSGWDKSLEAVTKNAIYTATYKVSYADTVYSNGLLYELSDDEYSYYIRRYTGSDENVVIPATFDNKPVTAILSGAFKNNDSIKSIRIGANIKYIGENAFINLKEMEEVTVAEGNQYYKIENDALVGSFVKTKVVNNETVVDYTLKSLVYLPATRDGFYEIADDVTVMRGCLSASRLNDLKFNTKVFRPINVDNNLTVSATNKEYANYVYKDLFGGTLADVENSSVMHVIVSGGDISAGMFANSNLQSISLYDNEVSPITTIGSLAFYNCSSLESMVIPNSVEKIERRAYQGCAFKTLAIGVDKYLNLQVVEDYAFDCDVEETKIEDGIQYIGTQGYYANVDDANPYVLAYKIDDNIVNMVDTVVFNPNTLIIRDELLADDHYDTDLTISFNGARIRSIGSRGLYKLGEKVALPSSVNYIGANPISNVTVLDKDTNNNYYFTDDEAIAANRSKYYVGGTGTTFTFDNKTKVVTTNVFSLIEDVTITPNSYPSNYAFQYDINNKLVAVYTSDMKSLLFVDKDIESIELDTVTTNILEFAFYKTKVLTVTAYNLEYIDNNAFSAYVKDSEDKLVINFGNADNDLIDNRFRNIVYLSNSIFNDTNMVKFNIGNKLAFLETFSTASATKLNLIEDVENNSVLTPNAGKVDAEKCDKFQYYEKVYKKLGLIDPEIDHYIPVQ